LSWAVPALQKLELNGAKVVIDVIDVMTFDDTGTSTSRTAYFGPRNVRQQ